MRKKISLILPTLFIGIALSFPQLAGGEPSLLDHWKRPAKAGNGHFSLHPEKCGSCHAAQYEAWRGSRHAKAVGSGLLGQLDFKNAPETALSCYQCHAPLSEQQEVKKTNTGYGKNKGFDERLKSSGVSCAVCHVRDGAVSGPPASKGFDAVKGTGKKHGKPQEQGFFQTSEFCAACHQLDDGYELNGTPLTNTFREWQQSSWGQNGVQCQQCHMPDRQHLFRGIHDKETTLSAVGISVSRDSEGFHLTIANTGVGHFFPTYVTPLIVVKAYVADDSGNLVAGTLKEDFIGRSVSLDLETQGFDTRIPPGGKHEFTYSFPGNRQGRTMFEIWVYPDRFYNRFFESLVKGSVERNNVIRAALRETERSPYLLWKAEGPLSPDSRL